MDIKILDVEGVSCVTDRMILCTGRSNRHVKSTATNLVTPRPCTLVELPVAGHVVALVLLAEAGGDLGGHALLLERLAVAGDAVVEPAALAQPTLVQRADAEVPAGALAVLF